MRREVESLPLLIGFIIVVAIIDLLLTGAIAKLAIFAPVFAPLLMKLGVEPETVLAAYRVGSVTRIRSEDFDAFLHKHQSDTSSRSTGR